MSLYDYRASREIAKHDFPFYALIMAAMRKADTENASKLREAFPKTADELFARYNAPYALLEGDPGYGEVLVLIEQLNEKKQELCNDA